MTKTRFTLFLLLIAISAKMLSSTRFYDDEQLSSTMITDIVQDSLGYIWIGTEYGLNKFDGVHFTPYYNDETNEHSLADGLVRHLMVDREGRLWVVTNTNIQRYNPLADNFEKVTFSDTQPATISGIQQAPSGDIWLLSKGGLWTINTHDLRADHHPTIDAQLREDYKDNMLLDSKGRLWVGYRGHKLQMIDTHTGQSVNYDDILQPNNTAVDVVEDHRHRILLLTYSSVLLFNEHSHAYEPVVTFPRNSVHRLYLDRKNRVFIGTTGSGLWMVDVDKQELTSMNYKTTVAQAGLPNAKVHAFLEDHDNHYWVGCHQRGLIAEASRPYPFSFLPLSQVQEGNKNSLRTIFADSQGALYLCQEKGGIRQTDFRGQSLAHWMQDYTVMTLYENEPGSYWVGTYKEGLNLLNTHTGQVQQVEGTHGHRIGSITKDQQGNIYAAVFSVGLRSFTPDGRQERILGKGKLELVNAYLNKLFTDRSGRIWIGHYYGIDVYDPKTDALVDVHVPEALRPAITYSIAQSPDGSVWIGSNKGLFQYYTQGEHRGQWRRFTTREGLPNDIVCGIVITADGTLWVSTYRGMAEIDTKGRFTRYYKGNGLQEWSYLRGVYAQTTAGEIIFGNENGFTYFIPDKIVKDEFHQGITLTGMRLGNADVNSETLSDGKHIIAGPLEEVSDITVSYLDNTFSLRFSTMDYRDAQNVHYEYRFDDEPKNLWHETPAGVSEIYFSHVSIGRHLLMVRAYDNGLYSPVKELYLNVSPPWYRTWGAYVFYLMLLVAIGFLLWHNYWNRKQAETREEKIKFFVDISHELRSPLTLIKSPLEELLRTASEPSSVRALRNIERNTNRLLTLTNQILSIRKIEKGQMQLHFAETTLGEFIDDIVHDYDYQVDVRKLNLTFDNQAPDMKVWIDRDHFDKVITNLINNALKFVPDSGEIRVTLSQSHSRQAKITVSDNGPGIDEAQLRKIFERFYQASARPQPGQMSYGIGLNLTHKLIALHKGTIEAHNRPDGHGAEFVIRLQLGSAHLPQEQLVDNDYFASQTVSSELPAIVTDAVKPRKVRVKTNFHLAVVDDDEEIRQFLQTELGENYHVKTYVNGEQAFEGIVDTVPDLVISDVVMPKMDGFELVKRLKSTTTTSHIPVILLTTKTEHQSRVEGLQTGADAYVDKPFNLEELQARISSLIANRMRMKGKFSGMQEQEEVVRKVALKGNDAVLMDKIMKAVNERLDDSDFNVEALADAVGLSRVQLHRRMKELTGITVGEFIRNLRLQQAAKLLAAGDTTVSQVTYAVGFANPTHFSSAFKKHFGVTPSEYMEKHRIIENYDYSKGSVGR